MTDLSPLAQPLRFDGTNVTAVLGPTNTGKTFLAIERMVAHSSGTIGLPLRLLAREVYGKVCDRVGVGAVSLITGEEKIKPPNARYAVCTVEAMPREPGTAFVAIDEVQLAADLERGHVFTDRILHARGREETLLLGSSTMQGVLQRLLKGAHGVTRPRLSNLVYAGSRKITRLPRRSAIVAFSADEVYAIAELIRRQRGGAAVVLGALSPRTRNAQVALYQSGEVDFLVATDAIGMGLNLDVDHVAFAQDWKFDGFQYRQLTPAEFGQIAGRAGRHIRDGTFGVTGKVDPLPPELVEALEGHSFAPVRVLQWRNRDFDFSSVASLKHSLDAPPPTPELTRSLPSVDQRALEFLSRDPAVAALATTPRRVELLWEACKLPDYRRIAPAQHAEIIASVYADVAERGHVAEDYMAVQVRRADRTEGDIDTLSQRIAEIRTWTYISHRPGWLADPTHWQEKTRDIEDRLSDALHERLTKRFVDRRTSVLMKRLRENALMEAEIGGDGTVLVEGHHVGELQGFRFTPDTQSDGPDAKAVRLAAQKALAGEFEKRAERFANAPNGDLALGSDGLLRWLGAPVAALSGGDDPLKPRLVLFADEQLTGPARDKVAARAERFVTYQVSTVLKPLADLKSAEGLQGAARGIAYRLYENYGLVQRRDVAEEVRSLDQDARAALRRCGVRFGAYHIFIPALVKPAPANLLTLLWAVGHEGREKPGFGDVTNLLATGRTSAATDPAFDPIFYALAGYRLLGRRAVRVDILERLADLIRPALAWKPGAGRRPEGGYNGAQFIVTPAMMSILGATAEDMDEILKGLGYRAQALPAATVEGEIRRLEAEAAAADAAALAAKAAQAAMPAGTADGTEAAAGDANGLERAGEAAAAALGEAGPDETDAAPAAETASSNTAAPPAMEASDITAQEPDGTEPDADPEGGETDGLSAAGQAAAALGEAHEGEAAGRTATPDVAENDARSLQTQPEAAETQVDATHMPGDVAEPALPSPGDERQAAAHAPGDVSGTSAAPAVEGEQALNASAPTGEPEEIKTIQVWRLQRSENRNNNRGDRGSARQGARGRGRGAPAAAAEQPAERGRHAGSAVAKPGEEGAGTEQRAPRFEKAGPRFDKNNGRFDKGGNKPKHRPEGDRGKGAATGHDAARHFEKPPARPQRIDPDSPFAKLAILKDKLGK